MKIIYSTQPSKSNKITCSPNISLILMRSSGFWEIFGGKISPEIKLAGIPQRIADSLKPFIEFLSWGRVLIIFFIESYQVVYTSISNKPCISLVWVFIITEIFQECR